MKALIMAGGSGTRLWPLSREKYPKQFLKLFNDKSLLRATYERLLKIFAPEDIIIATHKDYKNHVINDLYPYKGYSLILELERKSTGPTVLLGVLYALEELKAKEDEVLLVAPSDHYISPEERYLEYVKLGERVAKENYMVAFGIKPTRPDTNFGYVKLGEPLPLENAYKIDSFVEKPPKEKAEEFLREGKYFWNSGSFCFKLSVCLEEIKQNAPEIWEFAKDGYEKLLERYKKLPEIAFDYMEMEKTKRGAVIPMDVFWSDIGSFAGLYEILPTDEKSNATKGDVFLLDAENTLAYSKERLLVLVGLRDVAVVEERDALLVINKNMSEKVRDVVKALKQKGRREVEYHLEINESWGKRILLDEGTGYRIYKLVIYPEKRIGPQMHMHSTRTFMILKGTVLFSSKSEEKFLSVGDSGFVPKATYYSIENRGLIPAEIIEVRVGEYLEDDDLFLEA